MEQDERKTKPVKKKPGEIQRNPIREISLSHAEWEEFQRGVQLFNSGEFWLAHEAWENVWKAHDEDERLFFQGIIQLAAAYHQIDTHASFRGLISNFGKAYEKLEVFAPSYLGVYVKPLLKAIEVSRAEAEERGEKGMRDFPSALIPKIQFHAPDNPDLTAELQTVFTSAEFREGISLFNEGLFWEAHEAWEEIWRELDGEAKQIMHAFVQTGSAYSFMRLARPSAAVYLYEKSLSVFEEFGGINKLLDMPPVITHMRKVHSTLQANPGATVKLSSLGALPVFKFRS